MPSAFWQMTPSTRPSVPLGLPPRTSCLATVSQKMRPPAASMFLARVFTAKAWPTPAICMSGLTKECEATGLLVGESKSSTLVISRTAS